MLGLLRSFSFGGRPTTPPGFKKSSEYEIHSEDGGQATQEEADHLHDFEAASRRVKEVTGLSNNIKLDLYSLYKQGTEGDCTGKKPNTLLDYIGAAKWQAWSALNGMAAEEAKIKYVKLVNTLTPPPDHTQSSKEKFLQAAKRAKSFSTPPSDTHQMELYGLFNQATKGACSQSRPSIFDPVGQRKWQSWKEHSSLSEVAAMSKYVALVKTLSAEESTGPVEVNRQAFDDAVERVKHLPSKPPQDKQLKLYGLFKQVTKGPCTDPKPGMFDVVGQRKWAAWSALEKTTPEAAMGFYLALVNELGAPSIESIRKTTAVATSSEDQTFTPATMSVDDVLAYAQRPTKEFIKERADRAQSLGYGAEHLRQFEGKRPLETYSSLYEIAQLRARISPTKLAYTHLEDGEREGVKFTYSDLDKHSRAVAAGLSRHCSKGDRVLLLYPQTLDFVSAFFGCLYLGAISVPSYPPHPARLSRLLPRLLGIIEDCKPSAIATTKEIKEMAQVLADQIPQLASIPLIATDELSLSLADEWKPPGVEKDDVAFLQYTSGSTSAPKGVMVTHYNILYNLEISRVVGEMHENDVGVSWCPEFHDLGLIMGILSPAYVGYPLYLMSPEMFLQKPTRWVAAMSKFKGTISGGPNFAYDLAARKCTKSEGEGYDLSRWKIAFCGAEPVKISTARNFCKAFPSFPSKTFYPGYGLAEATLIIANSLVQTEPSHFICKTKELQDDGVAVPATRVDVETSNYRSVVSQGWQWLDNKLIVVKDSVKCAPLSVGEVWVKGPTVAQGYWGNETATEEAFRATVEGEDGHWLRTGDLGFLTSDGECFITGRSKDVLIINGTNYYPHDLEWTCEATDSCFKLGSVAAFMTPDPDGDGQRLNIVQEIDPKAESEDLESKCVKVIEAVQEKHGLAVHRVVLLTRGNICKTTSGKIQRRATKAALESNELEQHMVHDHCPGSVSTTLLTTNVAEARKFTWRPTPADVAAMKEETMSISYSPEHLRQFEGKRPLETYSSLYEIAQLRARISPTKLAYTHLEDGEREGVKFTYSDLDKHSRAVAAGLSRHCSKGDRVLLLYPQTLDFVSAFFGCLYLGAISVPSYPPHPARLSRLLPRLLGIIEDCKPSAIATTKEIKEMAQVLADQIPQLASIPLIATDELSLSLADEWKPPGVEKDDVAFLQYTSGSTSAPKGVMVTHYNILYNLEISRAAGEMHENDVGVSWCPEFHDLGLIMGILSPAYVGYPLYLMSPEMFLQKPTRWVAAMSKFKGTISGGPNFAYDLASKKCTKSEGRGYDLSRWRIAFCGAEPVKMTTARNFCKAFPSFPSKTFYPGYGLAEATLIIANKLVHMEPTAILLDVNALSAGKVKEATDAQIVSGEYRSVVSQGIQWLGNTLSAVDAEGNQIKPEDMKVGEVIVKGPTVAKGYWDNEAATETAFKLTFSNVEGEWLRTGDLGFILPNGECFITGRIKDVINMNGSNIYPQDLEGSCEVAHKAVRKGCCAAFEHLDSFAVVIELDTERSKGVDFNELCTTVHKTLETNHGYTPAVLVLIPPRTISKTSSGKIQRAATKKEYLSGNLEILKEWEKKNKKPDTMEKTLRCLDVLQEDTVFFTPHASPMNTPKARSAALKQPFVPHSASAASIEIPPEQTLLDEEIAIVGIGCITPAASTPTALWDLLKSGGTLTGKEIPAGRWPEGSGGVRLGSFFTKDAIESFDFEYFAMGEDEAAHTDPQHRLLLEATESALKDSCLNKEEMGTTGCFMGLSSTEYSRMLREHDLVADAAKATGMLSPNEKSACPMRILEKLGLRGTASAIDTACSSSLVAVHDACRAIREGACDHAIVGGANLILTPDVSEAFAKGGFLSPDGHCKTFDSTANGYARGEGAATIILKPLSAAVASNDKIYATIKGTAVIQDGKSNGLTAPNGKAQEDCITKALQDAGVQPSQISFIEAHGTGTFLGDPIELAALESVFGTEHLSKRCRLGGVKPNIGHLEAAAGVFGLVKVALSMHHGSLTPSVNYTVPNPHCGFVDRSLQKTYGKWPGEPVEGRRYAGCSSFGFGGTNAHAVLGTAPEPQKKPQQVPVTSHCMLPLTAPTEAALNALKSSVSKQIRVLPDNELASYCRSVARRTIPSSNLQWPRVCVTGYDKEDIASALVNKDVESCRATQPVRIGFVFSGQGPQWIGMGSGLYTTFAPFRKVVNEVAHLYEKHSKGNGFNLRTLFEAPHTLSEDTLQATVNAQPAIFALQLGLVEVLSQHGVTPVSVLGHSLGEIAAAVVAGSLDLESAVVLVHHRSTAMHTATGAENGMAALSFTNKIEDGQESVVESLLEPKVVVASWNSDTDLVLSGPNVELSETIRKIEDRYLGQDTVKIKRLPVQYAFHNPHVMHNSAATMKRELGATCFTPGTAVSANLYSTASIGCVKNPLQSVAYWHDQMVNPVSYREALAEMVDVEGLTHVLEVSPHPVLQPYGARVPMVPTLCRVKNEVRSLDTLLGSLFEQGAPVMWPGHAGHVKIPQPVYHRTPCWAIPDGSVKNGSLKIVNEDYSWDE